MEENLKQKPEQSDQSEANTSTPDAEPKLSELIFRAPYLNDRVGEAFIIFGGKPKSATKDSSTESK